MGLMDKVKAQAEQALAKGKEGVAQGQAKLEEVQAKRQGDALLRELGLAYYKGQREGGSAAAVSDALAKVDAHVAEHGSLDAPSGGAAHTGGGTPPGGASGAADGAPAGDDKLDDL